MHYLWQSYLFSKYLKFDADSRNGTKNGEKPFRFSDNCIELGV